MLGSQINQQSQNNSSITPTPFTENSGDADIRDDSQPLSNVTSFPKFLDEAVNGDDYVESEPVLPSCSAANSVQCKFSSFSKITLHPSMIRNRVKTTSTITMSSKDMNFFCDWNPELFGVDEEKIPSETEEFGEFEEILGEEPEKKPRYGRRARPKPNLTREDGREFKCICDIDETFERHYISRFGGGIKSDGEEWRVPHFSTYWEHHKERLAVVEDPSLMKLLDIGMQEEPVEEKKEGLISTSFGKNLKLANQRILERLRPLTCRELRRHRIPLSEAIILELQEDGFQETAEFLKSLLNEEYHLGRERKKSLTIRENKPKLLRLVKSLTAAEKKERKQEYNIASTILLKTGKHFSDSQETWWWLAERLFEKAIEAGSKYIIDGGKSKAIAHYIYGVHLLNQARKVRPAEEHLNKARELSLGRTWSITKINENEKGLIHKECNVHLCRALIETSKQLRKEGKPEEALRYIHQSYKLCKEIASSKPEIELDTLFELGMTYQDVGQLEWAKAAFKMFIWKAKIENSYKRACDGYIELAICYRMTGEINNCLLHLKNYLNQATIYEDENLIAFGNKYLGEFLLNHGYSREAVDFLEKAFKIFFKKYEQMMLKPWKERLPEELTLSDNIEMVRTLIGLAKGEILTKPICKLILRAKDVRNKSDTLKLLKWKNDNVIPFDLDTEYERNNPKDKTRAFVRLFSEPQEMQESIKEEEIDNVQENKV